MIRRAEAEGISGSSMIITTAARPTSAKVLQRPGGRPIELGARPLVMGVLNLTPDSFSDGGLWVEPESAVLRARSDRKASCRERV